MGNTLFNILFLELVDCLHNQALVTDVQLTDQLPRSQCLEVPLELTEHELDGVEIRSVR